MNEEQDRGPLDGSPAGANPAGGPPSGGGSAPDRAAGPAPDRAAGSAPDWAAGSAPDWAADLTPAPRRRLNAVTVTLLAIVLVAAGFAGGVAIQRNQQTTTAAAGRPFGARFAAGALPSGDATPGRGFGGGAFGAGGTPAVSGTVSAVGNGTITVKSTDGGSVTVHISSTTTVSERGSTTLATGAQVQVLGTKAADGSVDATAVVTRRGA
jgi:hypothetical protein